MLPLVISFAFPLPLVRLVLPPRPLRLAQIKSFLSYSMLMMIVGGVGLACVKEGKGVDINMAAFGWASFANLAGARSADPDPRA